MLFLAKQKIQGQYTGETFLRDASDRFELTAELRAHGVDGELEILDDSEFDENDIDELIKLSERKLICLQ